MTNDIKRNWVKKGYEMFAISGQDGLKIEPLAKAVGKSKSSFYHHFADLEIFTDYLLKYHLEQSYIMANKEENANNIDPELIEIFIEHRLELLFSRQLRINQNNKSFSLIILQSNKISANSIVPLWVKDTNLQLTQEQLDGIFTLALENFYMQITAENLNYNWLSEYFANIKKITSNLI